MRHDDIRGTIERLGVLRDQIEAIEWNVMIDAREALDSAIAVIESLSATNQRLNRRCQGAESTIARAIPEYDKILAMPPDGDGVRFVSGSLGRALLAYYVHTLKEELEQWRNGQRKAAV